MRVPAISLTVDVAVDEEHVNAIADNIKENGQLAPIVVRKLTFDIVDGFHRTAALQKLGMDADIIEREFSTDEDFLAARVVSATQHEGVKVERAVHWIEDEWQRLPIATKHKTVAAAFSAVAQGTASDEVADWVERTSKRWGVAVSTMKNQWLYGQDSNKQKVSSKRLDTPKLVQDAPQRDTTKLVRDPSDPASLPPRLRNMWADAKVFVSTVSKLDEEDFTELVPIQRELLGDALDELEYEAARLHDIVITEGE